MSKEDVTEYGRLVCGCGLECKNYTCVASTVPSNCTCFSY